MSRLIKLWVRHVRDHLQNGTTEKTNQGSNLCGIWVTDTDYGVIENLGEASKIKPLKQWDPTILTSRIASTHLGKALW